MPSQFEGEKVYSIDKRFVKYQLDVTQGAIVRVVTGRVVAPLALTGRVVTVRVMAPLALTR
jgi:hypothetical protein